MKSKGFVFVETIVIIAIMSVGLMLVYQTFSSVISSTKRRAGYNDISYIYRTYYIENYLSSLNINNYLDTYFKNGGAKIKRFTCSNDNEIFRDISDKSTAISFCNELFTRFNVKDAYISVYNISDSEDTPNIKDCITNSGKFNNSVCNTGLNNNNKKFGDMKENMSTQMLGYLRTLNGSERDAYRLIVEYREAVVDYDTSITKIKGNDGQLTCPNSFDLINGNCLKKIYKRYYGNVVIMKKR